MISHVTPAMAEGMANLASDHEDTVAANPRLSLHEVLQQVVAIHPQQSLLAAHQQMVQARRTMANSWLPQAPSVGFSHQNDALMSNRDEREWQAQVQIPIWLPGQRQARSQVASLADDSLSQDRAGLQQLAADLLRNAVWDIAMRRNDVGLADARRNTMRSLSEDVQKRFKAGEVAKLEVMQVDQETLQAERLRVTAHAELMHAQFRYQQLTGLNEIPAKLEESLSTREDYADSPYWQAAQAKVKLAEGQRDLTMIEQRQNPQLTLSTRTIQGGFDYAYNSSMGVAINIPLQSEVQRAPLLANAEQNIGDARTQLETLRRQLENNLHEAEHNLHVSRQELTLIQQQQAIATENASLARKAYRLGELDLNQLLRLQLLAFEAERSLSSQQLQVQWNIAKYNQAVGVLP
ncbi:TolC family protein [Methylophilus sp. 14]|uniref:TolC family protein n=1 Tax=Methylophilus sp. 14 TaxID=2781019 RepID=UPI00188F1D8F|nr:TolC family protein [Methylophilus sp. 14]MBF4988014.1 TolC family protein [Methylophilus sp. 14]